MSFGARRAALIAVGIVISIAATWLVTRGVDLERTSEVVARASPGWLLGALAVIALQVVVRASRWRLLLPAADHGDAAHRQRPSIARIVPVLLVGYLGNATLPGRLGDAARGVLIARREALPIGQTLGSVLIERLIDTFVLALLGIGTALLIGVPGWMVGIGMIGVALSVVALIALAIMPRLLGRFIGSPLIRFISSIARGASIVERPGDIGGAIFLSTVGWLLDASIYWLVGQSLGLDLSPVGATLIAAVTVLSTAVPSAPGYVGTFELAAVAAAGVVGIDGATGLAFAIVVHAVAVLPIALAGAASLAALGTESVHPSADDRPEPGL